LQLADAAPQYRSALVEYFLMSTTTAISTPPSTLTGKTVALLGVVISCAYLANLGAGVFLEIPDILPGIGNLDEVFFTTVLLASLAKLGIPILPKLR